MIEKFFIAKSGANTSQWLSLWNHHADTAEIMKRLLHEFVSDSYEKSCGLQRHQLRQCAIFLALVHDIGKATISFQCRISYHVSGRMQVLEHYGLCFPNAMDFSKARDTPHALVGEVILRYLHCPESVAAVVGAHHGVPTEAVDIFNQDLNQPKCDILGYRDYFGDQAENRKLLEAAWQAIVDHALAEAGLHSWDELPELLPHAQMLLSGLLIMADWIASNTNFFPLCQVDDTLDVVDSAQRAAYAWSHVDFPAMWTSVRSAYSDTEFQNAFGFFPNDVQKTVLQVIERTSSPGILILEAPMGCGKTEAALSAAELLASKLGKNGLFFGLPTQATANGIFPRIQDWGEKQSESEYHAIQLKHASADLNPTFRKIQRGIPAEETDSGLVVHSWFCENKKACLAGFVVATVDQMLMSALRRRHVMLLHLGLSEKVIIIDEVHAYDAYMNQYLERALQWLGAYHTPVILLSATLPAQRRAALIQAYSQNSRLDPYIAESNAYPLLTWTDGNDAHQHPLPYTGSRKTIRIEKAQDEEVLGIVHRAVQSGACVGLILNTVNRAQHMADLIRREVTERVLLYHAQYIMPDRAKKEEILVTHTGKASDPAMRKGFVVVGTQVLEQSLDIDFDLLITDICPMDLLLQRMGRLHRHLRANRPETVQTPVCYVLTNEYDGQKKTGSQVIYGDWLLQETLRQIPKKITLPDDISPLVQQVYSASDESEIYQTYTSDMQKARSRARAFLLDRPDDSMDDTIHGLLARSIKANDDSKAEASVRDGIASLEVLAMQRKSDGTMGFLDGTALPADPSEQMCIRIASQKLRLPSQFCQPWNIDKTIEALETQNIQYAAEWQNSHWLKGKLVLFFDENGETNLAGYRLRYSTENGLQYEKEQTTK